MSKVLDVTEKQILRGFCLKICEQAEPLGAGTEVIYAVLKKSGYGAYEKADIAEACEYLQKAVDDVYGLAPSRSWERSIL